ncbi:tRNA (adenine-N1)-methyltransferase [Candidatus Nitrosocosmicus franklandus]|uniref:tRNA (Adenine(58)-N(1))-methyltransferase TrmI n=1 Tax=Candidatus Nitrosocosmicus franklandianus TaxID=1798806 RepID=A0A484I6H7_9ARCH|nr:tRNA (adenine-N1)-methyltransferase [Candidatus Nitrosocosmicus franklandus]VFJ12723.1 tRNA (Adenine(58)-N(1))-methyltransferase TrmI [Candidatus Nitrosocosmicus franklandus]
MLIEEGSLVLYYFNSDKKWLIRAEKEKKLHTHLGIIDVGASVGLEYGSSVYTNKDKRIFLLPPTTFDLVMKSQRTTQIVYPKDYGYIAARTGLRNGFQVLEIGTGSAALSTFLASIVMPNGHIHTFDINEDFMSIAKKNLEKSGMIPYVTQRKYEPESIGLLRDIDLVIIDLGDPWQYLEIVHPVMKSGASVVCICPTMNQLENLATSFFRGGFVDVDCVEIFIRKIEAREGKTRPSMRMIGHTTYLGFARKVLK